MSTSQEKIMMFKSIASNPNLNESEVKKFLEWGKGDIEQALNYYYIQLQKGKVKHKDQEQKADTNHQKEQSNNQRSSVIGILKQASIKQQKTHQFIQEVRKKYQLPIKGRSQQDILTSSKPTIEDKSQLAIDNISSLLSKDISVDFGGNLENSQNEEDFSEYEYKHVYPSQRSSKSKQASIKPMQTRKSKLKIISESENSSHQMEPPQPQKSSKKTPREPEIHEQPQMKEKQEEYSFKEKFSEVEIYIGECLIDSFSMTKRKLDDLSSGCPIQVQSYIESEKKEKKKNFSKKIEKRMSMYTYYQDKELGRIKDYEVRVILPLIDEGLIRMQFFVVSFPLYADQFKPIQLKGRVFLLKKAISEPVVECFQPLQKDKERVKNISSLLGKLNLRIMTMPLIKNRKMEEKKANKSFDIEVEKHHEEKRQEMNKKLENERRRMKSDFSFKPVQKLLTDVVTKKKQSLNSISQQLPSKPSQVQKKIIEIDEQQEKDKFSELIDLHDENIEPATPSEQFTSSLYPYQSLALGWMLRREGFLSNQVQTEEIHPLWAEYELPNQSEYRLFFNELTGQLSVKRPLAKIKCKGGILADEMGLGKTVMMASLIATNQLMSATQKQGKNLIIVPLTLLSQWESEIKTHTKGLKVLIYYSGDRKKYLSAIPQYDVILTTYGTVSFEFSKGNHINKSGIYRYSWFRVILDEAHYIKGRIIQTSKAIYELKTKNHWCLTGTPIQNHVGDIFSLIHFIKYTPWSEIACWNRFLAKPLEEGDESIYGILRTILKKVFLRRTKCSKDQKGRPIIELPERKSKIQLLTMNSSERQIYETVHKANELEINALMEKGLLEAKYMQVFEMLMRLRQICCHPLLFKAVANFATDDEFQPKLRKFIDKAQSRQRNDQSGEQYFEPIINEQNEEIRVKVGNEMEKVPEAYLKETLAKIKSKQLECCLICFNEPEDPVITYCVHIFCKSCAIRQIEENGFCASCRKPTSKDDFMHLPRQNRLNITSQQPQIQASTKMLAFLDHVRQMRKDDKAVVFSQFLGMLDLLQGMLKRQNINFVRMEGSNTQKERARIIKTFQEDQRVQIFLVSLKTAGVGLNLVSANKVFIMDPWWNPAVEEQAIERVHRIGQKRQVEIIRFITQKSIEMRMLELNTQKKMISQNILSTASEEQTNTVSAKIEKLKYMMKNY